MFWYIFDIFDVSSSNSKTNPSKRFYQNHLRYESLNFEYHGTPIGIRCRVTCGSDFD